MTGPKAVKENPCTAPAPGCRPGAAGGNQAVKQRVNMPKPDRYDHLRLPRLRPAPCPVPGWCERLRARRVEMGWTLADLARKLGVSKQHLSMIELGRKALYDDATADKPRRRGPKARPLAAKLAKLLGMDAAEFDPG